MFWIYLDIECHLHGLLGDVDCILQCDPGHTELNLLHAAHLPLLLGLTRPSVDEPDQQQMKYYLL